MIRVDRVFTEPLLEFGGGGTSSDIRDGLLRFGPVDSGTPKAKEVVRLGLVGTTKTVAAFSDWMRQCGSGLSGDDPLNPNFAPRFPGLDPTAGFRCRFVTDPSWVTDVTEQELKVEGKKSGPVIALADFFHKRIHALFDLSAAKPDVVICLPPDLVRKIVKPKTFSEDDDEDDDDDTGVDFHDYLKALCLQSQSKFQLIWPRTYTAASRGVQDPATRAWNLFAALFYKAGGIPWKLNRTVGAQSTCYVGISFARRADGGYMHSSLTQVFNDKGE